VQQPLQTSRIPLVAAQEDAARPRVCFALFLLDDFLAQFAFRGERAAIDYAKTIVLLVI